MKKAFVLKSFLATALFCCLVSSAQQFSSLDPLTVLSKMQFRGIATLTFVEPSGYPIPQEREALELDENGRLNENIEYVVRIAYKNLNKAHIVISNLQAWVLCVNQKKKDFTVRDWSMVFSDYVREEDGMFKLREFYHKYWCGELVRDPDPSGPRESAKFDSTLLRTDAGEEGEEGNGASLNLRFTLAEAGQDAGESLCRLLRLSNYINGSERKNTRLTLVLVGEGNALMSDKGASGSLALGQIRLVINLERVNGGWLVVNQGYSDTYSADPDDAYPENSDTGNL